MGPTGLRYRRCSAGSPPIRRHPLEERYSSISCAFTRPVLQESRTAMQIPRSWMARPVESKRVISSGEVRPCASPVRTRPSSSTSSRPTAPAPAAAESSPPPLACSHSSQKRRHRARARARLRPCLARPRRAPPDAAPCQGRHRGSRDSHQGCRSRRRPRQRPSARLPTRQSSSPASASALPALAS